KGSCGLSSIFQVCDGPYTKRKQQKASDVCSNLAVLHVRESFLCSLTPSGSPKKAHASNESKKRDAGVSMRHAAFEQTVRPPPS
ncbi:hypothetical protein LEMLEM_LOCUS16731, partial [Lemmus lemmus]